LANYLFNVTSVVQNAFTEAAIKKINNPAILHIATHAYFSPATSGQFDNPMLRSGLLLTGAELTLRQTANGEILTGVFTETEDGILTAYEAQLLTLDSTEPVVLSACETGLGEVRAGEGVYGLQRGFKVAGAKHLIMSLWRVNDQVTQELMVLFYQYYKQFNHLQTAFKKQIQQKYPQPYYWGAFILIQ
jgi:CHAT domain-containing protein